MSRRIAAAAVALLLCILASVSAFAATERTLSTLAACSNIRAYSGAAAYFYGWSNHTLCTERAVPGSGGFSANTDGTITCAAHDSRCAYALVRDRTMRFSLMMLNAANGSSTTVYLDTDASVDNRSVAVSGSEVFLIYAACQGAVQSFSADGAKRYRYTFSDAPMTLFINDDRAYVLTYRGGVYRISNGGSTFCGNIGDYAILRDAGAGYVMTGNGTLFSLNGGTQSVDADFGCAVRTASGLAYQKGGTLSFGGVSVSAETSVCLAACGDSVAALSSDGRCTVYTAADVAANAADSAHPRFTGQTELKTIVSKLCDRFPGAAVYDSSGARKTSGSLKTGDTVVQDGAQTMVIVRGDVTGNGICGAKDIRRVMEHLCGANALEGAYLSAADINGDGRVSNADLVLAEKMKNN